MKNKKIFNLGLYAEGIRQLKLIGILSLIVMTLDAVLIPLGGVIAKMSYPDYKADQVVARTVSGLSAHPFLIATFLFIAPLMALSLFSFLNKRNSSDFYHSLPHTRLCVYLSYTAALVTWIALLILSTSAVSIILHLAFYKFFTLILSSMIKLMIGCFIASLLVAASVITAMTITGTLFTNIVISGLIIFLPRFAIKLISEAVSGQLPIISQNRMSSILSGDINSVTGFVFTAFTGGGTSFTEPLLKASSQIYTFIIALLYFALAAVFFIRRKSESAERSAPNKIMQTAYRTIVTMAFCTVVCCGIFSNIKRQDHDVFLYVVLYIAAALIYATYELITTRKWKSVVKSLPGLAIVAFLNVALLGSMYGIYKTNLNFTPSADEIESVSIVSETAYYGYRMDLYNFFEMKNEEIELTDKELKETVASSLEKCVQALQNNTVGDYYSANANANEYTFKINLKNGGTKYRTIFVPFGYGDKISEVLESNDKFKEGFTTLPKPLNNTAAFREAFALDIKSAEKIIDTMNKELKTVDFGKWREYCMDVNRETYLDQVTYSVLYNDKTYDIAVPIFVDLFPETCDKYFKYVYEKSAEDESYVKNYLTKEDALENGGYYSASLYVYNEKTNSYEKYMNQYSDDNINTSGKLISECIKDDAAVSEKSFIVVTVNQSDGSYFRIITQVNEDAIDDAMDSFYKAEYAYGNYIDDRTVVSSYAY